MNLQTTLENMIHSRSVPLPSSLAARYRLRPAATRQNAASDAAFCNVWHGILPRLARHFAASSWQGACSANPRTCKCESKATIGNPKSDEKPLRGPKHFWTPTTRTSTHKFASKSGEDNSLVLRAFMITLKPDLALQTSPSRDAAKCRVGRGKM
jgi:hypothetical protein